MARDIPTKGRRIFGAAATQVGFAAVAVGGALLGGAIFGPLGMVGGALAGFAIPSGATVYRQSRALDDWQRRLEPKKIARVTPSSSSTWEQAETMLVEARRRIGRKSAMYRPLDKIVRAVRKLEKRMIDEPEMRRLLSRRLRRRVPLIAETAARYAGLSLFRADENRGRLRAAEGLLRRSADTLTRLSKAEATESDFLRLDIDAEVLGENMGADVESLTAGAAALHGAHHLTAMRLDIEADLRSVFDEAAERLERIADLVDRSPAAVAAARPFLDDELPDLLDTADLYVDVRALAEDRDHPGLVQGRETLVSALTRLEAVEASCVETAIEGFRAKAETLGAVG